MNENLNLIIFILDRSGSMWTIKQETIGGFNSFLEEQKKGPGDARFTLVLFDHFYELPYQNIEIDKVPELNDVIFQTRGMTALLDAVGRTIDETGKMLSEAVEESRPAKVIVAILTDGHENSSKNYSHNQVAEMIRHQQEVYGWEFIFIGANIDAPAVAVSLNIPVSNASNFTADPDGVVRGFEYLSSTSTQYRTSTSSKQPRTTPRSSGGL